MASAKEEPVTPAPVANGEAAPEAPADAVPVAASGGFKAFLPLLATLVTMPALAYALTTFVLLPKLKHALSASSPAAAVEPSGEGKNSPNEGGAHEGAKGEKGEHAKSDGSTARGGKLTYPFGKVLVNVSGSQGTRYLLTTFTLVGSAADFKTKIDASRDQLTDLASSTLGTKTIADLEKPGARNVIRSELISIFNNALGKGVVQEIYFTEFAVQ